MTREAPTIRSTSGATPARKDQRSAVTNGKRLNVVRPATRPGCGADALSEIISDIGHEGLSACERMEGEAARGAEIDLETYGTLTDRLGRAFQRLGLKHQPRDVTSLGDILRHG
jgi:hypothetical protein